MTSKFAGLAALASQPRPPVTPIEAARAAAQAVQTSLFTRLRKARGGPLAGRLAWMLVRAGDASHPDCEAAMGELMAFGETDLRLFALVAAAARDSLKSAGAAALAGEVVAAVESAGGARRGGANGG